MDKFWINYIVVERLDQGHLYLKSYLDSLYACYLEPLLGMRPLLYPVLYMAAPVHVPSTWTYLDAGKKAE
jgi:hypothetical protein